MDAPLHRERDAPIARGQEPPEMHSRDGSGHAGAIPPRPPSRHRERAILPPGSRGQGTLHRGRPGQASPRVRSSARVLHSGSPLPARPSRDGCTRYARSARPDRAGDLRHALAHEVSPSFHSRRSYLRPPNGCGVEPVVATPWLHPITPEGGEASPRAGASARVLHSGSRPAACSSAAVVIPTMPAPTTTTSTERSASSAR